MQAQAGFIDVDMRRAMELAVQPIIPRVIRATNACLESALLLCAVSGIDELRAPMPAYIVKGTNLTVFATDQQNALPRDIDESEVAFAFKSLDTTRAEPLGVKNRFAFAPEVLLVQVVVAGEGFFELVRHGFLANRRTSKLAV